MSLIRLVYTSTLVDELKFSRLVELADAAHAHNASCGVTGFLCYSNQRFLQVIEGDGETVNRIYHSRIVPASAHREPLLLHVAPIVARQFGAWFMGFANIGPSSQSLVQRYFPHGKMDAELITPEGALEFLRELSVRRPTRRVREVRTKSRLRASTKADYMKKASGPLSRRA